MIAPNLRSIALFALFFSTQPLRAETYVVPDVCEGRFDEPPKEFKINQEFSPQMQGHFGTCFGAAAKYLIQHYYLQTKSPEDPEIDGISFVDVLGQGTCGKFAEGGDEAAVLHNIGKNREIAYESKSQGISYPVDYERLYSNLSNLKGEGCIEKLTSNQVLDQQTLEALQEPLKEFDPNSEGGFFKLLQQHPEIKRVQLKPFNTYYKSSKNLDSIKNEIIGILKSSDSRPIALGFCWKSNENECLGMHATTITGYRKACCKGQCRDQFLISDSNAGASGWKMADPLVASAAQFNGGITFIKPCVDQKNKIKSASLPKKGAEYEQCTGYPLGDFSLHVLAKAGDAKGTKKYLKNYSIQDQSQHVNQKDNSNKTPLMWAISSGHAEVVKILIEAKADVNEKSGGGGMTPLQIAVHKQKPEIGRILLENGAHVNAIESDGLNPLMDAVFSNDIPMIRLLIQYGANLHQKNDFGLTPLTYAISRASKFNRSNVHYPDYEEIVDLLLSKEVAKKGWKLSPELLFSAAQSRHKKTIDRLLAFANDKTKNEALMLAVENQGASAAIVLLKRGANVNYESESHETPLCKAAKEDDFLVTLFLFSNAKIDQPCSEGTPLFIAAKNGNSDAFKRLIDHGADLNYKNAEGISIFKIAESKPEIQKIIKREVYTRKYKAGNTDKLYKLAIMKMKGEGGPQNLDEAKKDLEELEKKGSGKSNIAVAWTELARAYLGSPEPAKARVCLEKAAAGGDELPVTTLFNYYLGYYGGLANEDSEENLRQAEAVTLSPHFPKGHLGDAWLKLGLGFASTGSASKTMEYLEKSSQAGNATAMYYMYTIYSQGNGVAVDQEKAKEYLEAAAAAGSPHAVAVLKAEKEHQGLPLSPSK